LRFLIGYAEKLVRSKNRPLWSFKNFNKRTRLNKNDAITIGTGDKCHDAAHKEEQFDDGDNIDNEDSIDSEDNWCQGTETLKRKISM
jgi:hypothetical protein